MANNERWIDAEDKPGMTGLYAVRTEDVGEPYHTYAHWDGDGWWLYGQHATIGVRSAVKVVQWLLIAETKYAKFVHGDRVRKKSGSAWQGRIVGWYSTKLTPEGYAVESEAHPGSVQIYPAGALELVVEGPPRLCSGDRVRVCNQAYYANGMLGTVQNCGAVPPLYDVKLDGFIDSDRFLGRYLELVTRE